MDAAPDKAMLEAAVLTPVDALRRLQAADQRALESYRDDWSTGRGS